MKHSHCVWMTHHVVDTTAYLEYNSLIRKIKWNTNYNLRFSWSSLNRSGLLYEQINDQDNVSEYIFLYILMVNQVTQLRGLI